MDSIVDLFGPASFFGLLGLLAKIVLYDRPQAKRAAEQAEKAAEQSQVDQLEKHLSHYRDQMAVQDARHRLEISELQEKLRECERCCTSAKNDASDARREMEWMKRRLPPTE